MSHASFSTSVVDSLLVAGDDQSQEVRDQALAGLRLMASKDLVLVLQRGAEWLLANKPAAGAARHRFFVCKVLTETLRSYDASAAFASDPSLVDRLIRGSIQDFTAITDLSSEWSNEACALNVLMCEYNPAKGVQALLDNFGTSNLVVPHFYVVRCLADFADSKQPLRFAGSIREVVTKLLAILASVRQDNHKMFFARALGLCAEILVRRIPDALALQEQSSPLLTPRSQSATSVRPTEMGESMNTGLQMMMNEWSKSSELRVRTQVAFAVGALAAASSDDTRAASLGRLVPVICNNVKRENPGTVEYAVRGAAAFCRRPGTATLVAFPPHLDALCQCAIGCLASINLPLMNSDTPELNSVKRAREYVLMWIVELFMIDAAGTLNALSKLIDPKTTGGKETSATRAAVVNAIVAGVREPQTEGKLASLTDHVVAVVKLAINDTDWRVRGAVASLSVSMLESKDVKRYFAAAGSHHFLTYLVKQCSISNHIVDGFQNDAVKKDPMLGTSPMMIRESCRSDLIRLCEGPSTSAVEGETDGGDEPATSTAGNDDETPDQDSSGNNINNNNKKSQKRHQAQQDVDKVLWPFLLEHIASYTNDPELVNFFPTFLRCALGLTQRVTETEYFYVDFRANANAGKPQNIAVILLAELFISATDLSTGEKKKKKVKSISHNSSKKEKKAFSVTCRNGVTLERLTDLMSIMAPLLDEPFIFQHLDEVPTPVTNLWHEIIPSLLEVGGKKGGGDDEEQQQQQQVQHRTGGVNSDKNNNNNATDEHDDVDELSSFDVGQDDEKAVWEEVVCRFIGKTAHQTRSDCDWAEMLASAALALIPVYFRCASCPVALQRAMIIVTGVLLSRCSRRDFVASTIEQLVEIIDPVPSAVIRDGFARCLGYVAANREHGDVVLEKIVALSKPAEKKGFFSSFGGGGAKKDGKREQTEQSRAVAGAAAGWCVRRLPAALLSSRFEPSIMPILSLALDNPDLTVRSEVIDTLPQLRNPIRKLIQSPPTGSSPFVFKARDGLVEILCKLATNAVVPAISPLFKGSVGAPIPASEVSKIVAPATNFIAILNSITAIVEAASNPPLPVDKSQTSIIRVLDECFCVVLRCANQLPREVEIQLKKSANALVRAVVDHNAACDRRTIDLKALLPCFFARTASPDPRVRTTSLMILREFFMQTTNLMSASMVSGEGQNNQQQLQQPKVVICIGSTVGYMVPRIVDSDENTRKQAAETLTAALQLQSICYADVVAQHGVDLGGAASQIYAIQENRPGDVVGTGVQYQDSLLLQEAEKKYNNMNKELCGVLVGLLPTVDLFLPCVVALLERGVRETPEDPNSSARRDPNSMPIFYSSPTAYFGMSTGQTCATCAQGMLRGLGGSLSESEASTLWDTLVETCKLVNDRNPTPEQVFGVTLPADASNSILLALLLGARNLCKHHMVPMFRKLLGATPAPHQSHLVHVVQCVGSDANLATSLVRHCLDTLLNHAVTEDRKGAAPASPPPPAAAGRVLAVPPMQAASTLQSLVGCPKGAEAVSAHRCPAFGALSLYLVNLFDCQAADAMRGVGLVSGSIRTVIECSGASDVLRYRMERYGWHHLATKERVCHALGEVIKYIAEDETHGIDKVSNAQDSSFDFDAKKYGLQLALTAPTQFVVDFASFIIPYSNKQNQPPRRLSIILCGYLLRHAKDEPELIQTLITTILGRSGPDEVPDLRKEALMAFQVILLHPYAAVASFVPTIFSQLLSCLDDTNRLDVALCAIAVLKKLSTNISDKTALIPIFVTIILRLRTKFESAEPSLRVASISFFSELITLARKGFVDPTACEGQIDQHFITILLRIEDPIDEVREKAVICSARAMMFLARRQKIDALRKAVFDLFGDYTNEENSSSSSSSSKKEQQQQQEGSSDSASSSATSSAFNSKENVAKRLALIRSATLEGVFLDRWSEIWINFFFGKVKDTLSSLVQHVNGQPNADARIRTGSAAAIAHLVKQVPKSELARISFEHILPQIVTMAKDKLPSVRQKALCALANLPY